MTERWMFCTHRGFSRYRSLAEIQDGVHKKWSFLWFYSTFSFPLKITIYPLHKNYKRGKTWQIWRPPTYSFRVATINWRTPIVFRILLLCDHFWLILLFTNPTVKFVSWGALVYISIYHLHVEQKWTKSRHLSGIKILRGCLRLY